MKTLENSKKYTLAEIFDFILNSNEEFVMDNFNLYLKDDSVKTSKDMVCFISNEGIDINDNDNEIHPEFVIDFGLEFYCSGQLIEDVVLNTIHQKDEDKTKVTIEQLVVALDFYLQNDNFLTIE